MTDFGEILDAFEDALLLEAELGTRTVECDRALLTPLKAEAPKQDATRTDAQERVPPAAALSREARVAPATPPPPPDAQAQSAQERVPPPAAVAPPPQERAQPSRTAAAAAASVLGEGFREELEACAKCPLASQGRTHVVPGQGNANSPDYMFIGEAPGEAEDRKGEAFVGAAGQFLTKMINAMGYAREDVFIANVCKCRPPANRTPTPQEMEACLPYLHRQIEAVRPKCIVLLGRTAMNGLFPHRRIRRGVWEEYRGIPAIATFHPAYVLRFDSANDPGGLRNAKVEVWNTLKMALAKFGRTPPPRR